MTLSGRLGLRGLRAVWRLVVRGESRYEAANYIILVDLCALGWRQISSHAQSIQSQHALVMVSRKLLCETVHTSDMSKGKIVLKVPEQLGIDIIADGGYYTIYHIAIYMPFVTICL